MKSAYKPKYPQKMNEMYPVARDYGYSVCTTVDTPVSLSDKIRIEMREWPFVIKHLNEGQSGTVADMAAARVFEQIENGYFKPQLEASHEISI
jgi:hypothetical protein